MSFTVCLGASALSYPGGGGHLWAYMNWALGLQAQGCRVRWLELLPTAPHRESLHSNAAILRQRLRGFGFADEIVLAPYGADVLPSELPEGCIPVEEAYGADLFLNQIYGLDADIVRRFRRSALLDIDPGLLQLWMRTDELRVAPYDFYFTIGETVGKPGSAIPDLGLEWHYTPPCVAVEAWAPTVSSPDAALTTITHWQSHEWVVEGADYYLNDKRTSFLEFLDLPARVAVPLELAACFAQHENDDRELLRAHGWRVRESADVAGSPEDYQRYIQASRGEFSCAKPSCMRLQNAWISDRTLCYLASGKPAVVQHTGPSAFLPDADGLLRFRTIDEAARSIASVASDYERHARRARELAETFFDARKVAGRLLERAIP